MFEASIVVSGNLTNEPTLSVGDGVARVSFGVASTPRKRLADGTWTDGDTTYYQVTCWRGLAENVAQSLHKGQPVLVRGTFRSRAWDNGVRSGTSLDITADLVGHDLNRGVTLFRKISKPRAGDAGVTTAVGAGEEFDRAGDGAEFDVERGYEVVTDLLSAPAPALA